MPNLAQKFLVAYIRTECINGVTLHSIDTKLRAGLDDGEPTGH